MVNFYFVFIDEYQVLGFRFTLTSKSLESREENTQTLAYIEHRIWF